MRRDPWAGAVTHLRGIDDRWGPFLDRAGPCLLRPQRDRFAILVRAIIGQQISARAAATIDARLRSVSGSPHDPAALQALGEQGLRGCGLSGVKARYVLNLAEAVGQGLLPLGRIGTWSDEAIVDRLTTIKGIGTWTAQMFLIFALNRPDVLPTGDLGIRVGIRAFHNLPELPTPTQCVPLAAAWRPYRSIAMWYLWRGIEPAQPRTAGGVGPEPDSDLRTKLAPDAGSTSPPLV